MTNKRTQQHAGVGNANGELLGTSEQCLAEQDLMASVNPVESATKHDALVNGKFLAVVLLCSSTTVLLDVLIACDETAVHRGIGQAILYKGIGVFLTVSSVENDNFHGPLGVDNGQLCWILQVCQ